MRHCSSGGSTSLNSIHSSGNHQIPWPSYDSDSYSKCVKPWCELLRGLLTRCTVNRYAKDEKRTLTTVSVLPSLPFPLRVSRPPLDHQQGLAWRSSSWASFSRLTSQRANQLMSSEANYERVSVARRTQHPSALLGH